MGKVLFITVSEHDGDTGCNRLLIDNVRGFPLAAKMLGVSREHLTKCANGKSKLHPNSRYTYHITKTQ